MTLDIQANHPIELTHEFIEPPGVSFCPEEVRLQGTYYDQLSAYRARRGWLEALERCFLLESGVDYEITIRSDHESRLYVMSCHFKSACARYAFWRLTNEQAPEAQYLIETAHIPECESRQDDLLQAPDMRPLGLRPPATLGEAMHLGTRGRLSVENSEGTSGLKSILKRLLCSIAP
jgi:hypothetical protein